MADSSPDSAFVPDVTLRLHPVTLAGLEAFCMALSLDMDDVIAGDEQAPEGTAWVDAAEPFEHPQRVDLLEYATRVFIARVRQACDKAAAIAWHYADLNMAPEGDGDVSSLALKLATEAFVDWQTLRDKPLRDALVYLYLRGISHALSEHRRKLRSA